MKYLRIAKNRGGSGGKIVSDILPPKSPQAPKDPRGLIIQEAPALKPPTLSIFPKKEPPRAAPPKKRFAFLRNRLKRQTPQEMEFLTGQTEETPKPDRKQIEDLSTEIELPIRTWEPEGVKRRRRLVTLMGLGALAVIFAGFILPLAVFPKFTVTITPKVESFELSPLTIEALTAIAAPDAENRKIPATRLSIEAEVLAEQKATSRKRLAERANGTIVIFNGYSSSPQTLVSGTRFRAPDGKIFRLTKSIVIPGAKIEEGKIVPQSITAGVNAAEAGESYNIGPTEFRIPGFLGGPKYDGFYAKSSEPFQGGFEGEASVVSSEDIRRAEEEATSRLIKKLEEELAAKIPADQDLLAISGARETLVTEIQRPQVGSRAESFRVTAKGRGELMLIRRSHLFELLRDMVLDEEPMAALTSTQSKLALSAANLDVESSRMSVKISGEASFFRKTPADEVLTVLKSSTPAKAEAYLRSREEIASFRIKKFPGWLWFIPRREGGLKVVVEEPQG